MNLLSKNLHVIFSAVGISVLYFVSRIINILNVPIFTDEAIYVRWTQIAFSDASWRFISLTDGKQPSFVWAHMVTMRFFEDPLFSGRMVSVIAGFIALWGVFALTQLIFKNIKVSLFASVLYLVFPFALVYDRLALYESLIAMFFVWALFFQILLVRKLRLDVAMILGFVVGGAVLTKSSGFLAIYMMPFLYGLLKYSKKTLKSHILRLTLFLLIAVVIANLMYSILRLSPFFYIIEEKNSIFVYPVKEWLGFSLETKTANFLSNFRGIFDWFLIYFSIPFMVAVVASFLFREKYREKLLLFLWFFLPVLALLVFGKTLYPRYIFFMTIPLLPLVAYGFIKIISVIRNKIAVPFLFIALFAYPLYADIFILTDFARAPIPRLDLEQMVNGWPAGGGVNESIAFFERESQDKKIFVATEGTFGLMPFAYEINLQGRENVEVKGYWPIEDKIPQEVLDKAKINDTYFVFYQPCSRCKHPGMGPIDWPIEKVHEYTKGTGDVTLTIYRVKSN